jgi:Tfp pilus assembly protein PilO
MNLDQIMRQVREPIEKYLEAMTQEQRDKAFSYFYISLTLFTVSFFGFFAIGPTLTTISELNKQYKDNKVILDALNLKLSNLQLLDGQYRTLQPELAKIYSAIPATSKIPQLTRQIENIASQSNVAIQDINFGSIEIYPNTKSESIYSFTFNVSVVGDEASINNFVSSIISFDRIIGIDKIATGRDEQGNVTAEIDGRAYFAKK